MKDADILAAWAMFEEAEPDISTERLMQQTADHCKCDVARVAEALHREAQKKAGEVSHYSTHQHLGGKNDEA